VNLEVGDYFNLREHPIQTEYWWGTQEFEDKYGKLKINEILQVICTDMGLRADFKRLIPLTMGTVLTTETAGKIVFLPGTDGKYKYWEPHYWLELWQRLRKIGQDIIVIGQPERCQAVRELCEKGLPWVETPTLAHAVDLISASRLVIGVDTGLMHAAVQQGIPTVALYRSNPIYLREYSHVRALTARACQPECLGMGAGSTDIYTDEMVKKFKAGGWNCEAQERCMASITPDRVLESVKSLLTAGCVTC
jgi:ADP-heptose:LPS heptosyltransferase